MRREILLADLQREVRVSGPALRKLARAVLDGEKFRPGALSIALVDSAAMRRVNRTFLRHDFDTDVLAFPMDGAFVGEIVISPAYAKRQAARRDIAVAEEVARYLVHGILHLAGYDDHEPAAKKKMWARQESYLFSGRGR